MRDQEFSSRVREYSSPGEEVSRPGREWNARGREWNTGGREYGQTNGEAAPARKRRRIPLAVVAAAVVTGMVMTAAPAASPHALPQPENFTEEYRDYLDQLMTACETKDELELHRLATSDMASEVWEECLGPYRDELKEQGYKFLRCYYNGEEMSLASSDIPILYFSCGEEALSVNVYQNGISVRYYTDSERRQGVRYVTHYNRRDGEALGVQSGATNVSWFAREDMNDGSFYLEGISRDYSTYVTPNAQDIFYLSSSLEGRFITVQEGENLYRTYLEDGTLGMYFRDGSGIELEVRDGVLRIGDNPNVTLEWDEEGRARLMFYDSDHSSGRGTHSMGPVERLEDFLYHNELTTTAMG